MSKQFYFKQFSLAKVRSLMSKQSYFKQFGLALVHSLVLFDPKIEPYQVLPLRARVDLGAMAM